MCWKTGKKAAALFIYVRRGYSLIYHVHTGAWIMRSVVRTRQVAAGRRNGAQRRKKLIPCAVQHPQKCVLAKPEARMLFIFTCNSNYHTLMTGRLGVETICQSKSVLSYPNTLAIVGHQSQPIDHTLNPKQIGCGVCHPESSSPPRFFHLFLYILSSQPWCELCRLRAMQQMGGGFAWDAEPAAHRPGEWGDPAVVIGPRSCW